MALKYANRTLKRDVRKVSFLFFSSAPQIVAIRHFGLRMAWLVAWQRNLKYLSNADHQFGAVVVEYLCSVYSCYPGPRHARLLSRREAWQSPCA